MSASQQPRGIRVHEGTTFSLRFRNTVSTLFLSTLDTLPSLIVRLYYPVASAASTYASELLMKRWLVHMGDTIQYQWEAPGALSWPDWQDSTAFIAISCLHVLSTNEQYRLVSLTVSSWLSETCLYFCTDFLEIVSPAEAQTLRFSTNLTTQGQPNFLSATLEGQAELLIRINLA